MMDVKALNPYLSFKPILSIKPLPKNDNEPSVRPDFNADMTPQTTDEVLKYQELTGKAYSGNYTDIFVKSFGKTPAELVNYYTEQSTMRFELKQEDYEKKLQAELAEIKKTLPEPLSIFDDENNDISNEVKEYLADKPVTAARFQRLYEQSPDKAYLFLNNIQENGDYSDFDLDTKYKGWEYTEVLTHINALMVKNQNDVENGYYDRNNYLQKIFAIDDGIGDKYQFLKRVDNGTDLFHSTYDYIPAGADDWRRTECDLPLKPDTPEGIIELQAMIGTKSEKVLFPIAQRDSYSILDMYNNIHSTNFTINMYNKTF